MTSQTASAAAPRFSIVVLTYARDEVLETMLASLAELLPGRRDYEVVLVDNNADERDRSLMLTRFPNQQYVRSAFNKGVIARNDGMDAARGEIIILLDDDVFVQTPQFLDVFDRLFSENAALGVVTIRKLDHQTMRTKRETIPHTRKDVDLEAPFKTFRFVGGCLGFRAQVHHDLKGFSQEFFYGLEEIEYSYRVIEAGWEILYSPDVLAIEYEHPGGRRPTVEVQTMRLTNKFIISHIHMPFPQILVNYTLFPIYISLMQRGQVRIGKAVGDYLRWLQRPQRTRRRPIGARAQAYIRACRGSIWK
ncbi:glycosyltransferase family 2 protein [Caulobacter sp. LARHSG274]